MNQRGILVSGALTLLATTAFLSCNLFTTTSSVSFWGATLILGEGGQVTGVAVRASNAGDAVENAHYEVLLTLNDLDAYDATLYRGTATIPSGESTIQVSWDNHIKPYLQANSTSIEANYYRVGFQYDPEGRADNSRAFGQAMCPRQLWVINGSPCAYVASGTIAVDPSYNALYYDDGSGSKPLPDGNYDLYVGFASPDILTSYVTSTMDPETLFSEGWQRQSLSYDSAYSPSMTSIRCGVRVAGTYALIAFLDCNGNGQLDVYGGDVAEPVAVLIDPNGWSPTVVTMNDDVSGLILDWSSLSQPM